MAPSVVFPAAFDRTCFFLGHGVVHGGKFGCLEAFDFVAQTGGLFKVEVRCGVAHGFFQRVEMGLEIVADQMTAIGEALAGNA